MQAIFNIINIPLGFILDWISRLFGGNFSISVFVFTLIMNIAMIPLTVKSQKSAVGQLRVKPKLEALKEKYGDDRMKYNEAMQALYQKEGVSMAGGCLPMLIRLPIMMSIYWLIREPEKYMGGNLNFDFFGIDLASVPKFSMDIVNSFRPNWIIPILSFAAAMLSSLISITIQKRTNPDAPNMAGMMLTMPIISLVIAFGYPCALGYYWACSSLISGVIQGIVQLKYGPERIIAKERTNELFKAYNDELTRISKVKGE